ncbi:hypothetical protein PV10_05301 [Exophiala mesophila]|uniref:ABM domain-containing protein n=1 Tax=Exophiala mesophila TaxID=212818 RepID=A0A0D1Z9H3_EXOME|nr:uncharacterized protein PV10_05301 [Exophiala mesophila]KIV90669.1 hypothetical protein PV10_05301 [Exophiala mesophila]
MQLPTPPEDEFVLYADLFAKQGLGDQLEKYLRVLIRLTESEEGTLEYVISRDDVDRDHFHVFERYTGREAFEKHIAAQEFVDFADSGVLAKPPTPKMLKPLKALRTKVLFKKTDVSKWSDLEDLFTFARSSFGQVDILCNGAGVFEPKWSNFWLDTESNSYQSLNINVSALFKGTRLAIRDQIKRSANRGSTETIGVILNITSLAAQFALFSQPLYAASKAAVSSFTRSLAPLQHEFGIKVVAVAPGMVQTPLWTNNPDKMKAITADDVLITPEELAMVMLDLVQNDEYQGGTVLEALKYKTRKIEVGSPLPSGPGSTMSNMGLIHDETIELLRMESVGNV